MRGVAHLTARALLPEQLAGYVEAVAGSRPLACADCLAYDGDGQRTLVAWPPADSPEELLARSPAQQAAHLRRAVEAALADGFTGRLVVLGPDRPEAAPPSAQSRRDAYAFLPLPPPPPDAKLRNMLRRAARECRITEEHWGAEHEALARSFCRSRPLAAGTRHIFSRLGPYLAACGDAVLFGARRPADGALLGLAVGDYSSLTTACYMFAFRAPECPPGVSDALLHALLLEARQRGHARVNLGLDISPGIAAFKRKWGATATLPYVETSWDVAASPEAGTPAGPLSVYAAPGLWARLRASLRGERRDLDCLQVEVSSHCAGQCRYCPHTTQKATWRSRHMTPAVFAALHGLVRRARRVHLQGWGEPLASPHFFDFAAAARRAGCAVSTTTCGLGVTDAVARRLVAAGLDVVAFSLTGVDAAGNAARRGLPLERVEKGIAALQRAKRQLGSALPRIHLAYLLLASQAAQVAGLPAYMARHGVDAAVVSTLDYIPAPHLAQEAFTPGCPEAEEANRLLCAAARQAERDGRSIFFGLPGSRQLDTCAEHPESCLYADAEGMLSPCVYLNPPSGENSLPRRTYGSVLDQPAASIWDGPACRAFRTGPLPRDPGALCAACPKRFARLGEA